MKLSLSFILSIAILLTACKQDKSQRFFYDSENILNDISLSSTTIIKNIETTYVELVIQALRRTPGLSGKIQQIKGFPVLAPSPVFAEVQTENAIVYIAPFRDGQWHVFRIVRVQE